MSSIGDNLQEVKGRVAAACNAAGRDAKAVTLLAVSKTQGADAVREAAAAGQRAFGENYVQEGLDKIAALAGLGLQWHLIGPLQSNKTRVVAEAFRLGAHGGSAAHRAAPGRSAAGASAAAAAVPAGQRQRRGEQERRCAAGAAGVGRRGGGAAGRAGAPARADGHSGAGRTAPRRSAHRTGCCANC
jgi:hypothetical protein